MHLRGDDDEVVSDEPIRGHCSNISFLEGARTGVCLRRITRSRIHALPRWRAACGAVRHRP